MRDRPLVVATRRSPLALTQTGWVVERLRATGARVEVLELVTTGDRWSASGGADATRGLFVKELEEALLDGRADLAVHSAKDLPGDLPPGLAIVAVPEREDPRDVVVGPRQGIDALPAGARVGTGSARRAAQLATLRPDLDYVEIRGNVGTRIEKMQRGDAEAIVLAAAGLRRLGLWPEVTTPLAVEQCVPAAGQGVLAIEGRVDDPTLTGVLAALDDADAAVCLEVERSILAALGGGCREPIGIHARPDGSGIRVDVFAASEDRSRSVRVDAATGSRDGTDAVVRDLVERVRSAIGR